MGLSAKTAALILGVVFIIVGVLGYIIIGIFALSWAASVLIYRAKRFDELEVGR